MKSHSDEIKQNGNRNKNFLSAARLLIILSIVHCIADCLADVFIYNSTSVIDNLMSV